MESFLLFFSFLLIFILPFILIAVLLIAIDIYIKTFIFLFKDNIVFNWIIKKLNYGGSYEEK